MGEELKIRDSDKRVRIYLGGELVADTVHPKLVWEVPYYPTYYLPLGDVRRELLVETGRTERSEQLGGGRTFTVKAGEQEAADAAWEPTDIDELQRHVRFEWDAMDAWFEEDEEVFTHPRDPYSRLDILRSSRPVRVEIDGVVLAESDHPLILFETGLPPRWYLPKPDVRMDLLEHTDKTSHCPYKGQAQYWSARVGDDLVENVAWSYPTPLTESAKIAATIAFFNERVDLYIDGELQDRPSSPFS